MGSRYLTDLADVCRRAGLPTIEVEGWQKRARGSGGFDSGRPNHVMAHHTASGAGSDGWPDVNYCTYNDEDAPLCNLYLNRGGQVWVCAGGATNTNGSGSDPCNVTADDSMNSSAIGIEAGNNGTGETWPNAQEDAYIVLVNALCVAYGIPASRAHSHREWAPSRKVDPAGPDRWASGKATWNMDAFRNDLVAGETPAPQPPTPQPPTPGPGPSPGPPDDEDDDMLFDGIWKRENHDACYAIYKDGTKQWLMDLGYIQGVQNLQRMRGATEEMVNVRTQNDPGLFAAMGIIVGPAPGGVDQWGNPG